MQFNNRRVPGPVSRTKGTMSIESKVGFPLDGPKAGTFGGRIFAVPADSLNQYTVEGDSGGPAYKSGNAAAGVSAIISGAVLNRTTSILTDLSIPGNRAFLELENPLRYSGKIYNMVDFCRPRHRAVVKVEESEASQEGNRVTAFAEDDLGYNPVQTLDCTAQNTRCELNAGFFKTLTIKAVVANDFEFDGWVAKEQYGECPCGKTDLTCNIRFDQLKIASRELYGVNCTAIFKRKINDDH